MLAPPDSHLQQHHPSLSTWTAEAGRSLCCPLRSGPCQQTERRRQLAGSSTAACLWLRPVAAAIGTPAEAPTTHPGLSLSERPGLPHSRPARDEVPSPSAPGPARLRPAAGRDGQVPRRWPRRSQTSGLRSRGRHVHVASSAQFAVICDGSRGHWRRDFQTAVKRKQCPRVHHAQQSSVVSGGGRPVSLDPTCLSPGPSRGRRPGKRRLRPRTWSPGDLQGLTSRDSPQAGARGARR